MKTVLILAAILLFQEPSSAQKRFSSKVPYQKLSESNLDVKILRAFNNIESPFVNTLVSITNKAVVPVSAVLPLGLYASARISDNRYDENSAVLLGLSEALNFGATQGLKYMTSRQRPFRSLNNIQLSETTSVGGTYSFPSGHSSASFTIATLLTLRYPGEPWIVAGSYLYATVTSLGRLYWGVHYPSDVLCGMLIGAGSAALIYSLRSEIIPAKDKLFNQSSRPDTRGKSSGLPVVIGSVAAADILNGLLQSTGSKILRNTYFKYGADNTYSLNCKLQF